MKLSEAANGEKVTVLSLDGDSALQHRLSEMGFVAGREIEVIKNAPLADPIEYRLMGYEISLRRSEAQNIYVTREPAEFLIGESSLPDSKSLIHTRSLIEDEHDENKKSIKVGLVGNPNSGKTSLFNYISGMNEHVGNYSGVTIESKEATVTFEDFKITFVDLPGTYSIADFSPEEKVVTDFIEAQKPDLIVNILDSTNLERNLYLTTQLIDMEQKVVLALNMWDEFLRSGDKLDQNQLAKLLGMPIVNVIAKRGRGVASLLETIVRSHTKDEGFEAKNINYPTQIEEYIATKSQSTTRYNALSEAEKDQKLEASYKKTYGNSIRTAIASARYAFVRGALKESYVQARRAINTPSSKIDSILTNKYLGLPIFIGIIWLTFWATFTIGAYPMDWIDAGVGLVRDWMSGLLPLGMAQDLIVGGIIDGVGSVIIFLPNILILFLFISIMEDTGYMARTAFITDKLMHSIGLHGKSFIPLVMGFGCSVPAIMATRTIENRGNRLQTMLMVPFMSCSARLPVYILIVGAFFPGNEANVLFAIYFGGIILGILTSILLKKLAFKKAVAHFVMELPPYRIPTLRSTFKNMWNKGSQYLRKMGGIILVAAVIIWALGYFPRGIKADGTQRASCLETIGRTIEPVIEPLGFDWQMGVSLMSGVVAKEVVVSSMSVLYNVQDSEESAEGNLPKVLQKDPAWNNAVALSFLAFVLIYFPCIASVAALRRESGSWKWALFSMLYTTALAWCVSFVVYQAAKFFI